MIGKKLFFCTLIALPLPLPAAVIDIDNAELQRLTASGVPLVDIRTAGEWHETGVIAGSRLITFVDDRGRVDVPAWLTKIQSVAKPTQAVILICRSGNRTRAASKLLSEQAGFSQVYNVRKGLIGWLGESRPVTPLP
ncbi:MAG TPA: rhodanese-like domain-containing protein [Accumulibacter sp.]|jgi:rhodanese-related sulfurtransferase|nr:rhodanese-like domain-containing protein [Accumulibacter sp.]HPP46598.1 rhodanese-like domain-containing protein [Accumulibacter sp.]